MSIAEIPNSVGELLRRSARRFGDKTALVFDGERLSFRQLDEASTRAAAGLRRMGVLPGEAVALYSPNAPEWIIGYYAAMKLGAVVTPLNLMLTAEEAAFALNDCGAVAVIGSHDRIARLAPLLAKTHLRHRIAFGGQLPLGAVDFSSLLNAGADDFVLPPVDTEAVCTVCYTSGTTGHPKGAALTHRAILMNTAMTATMHARTAADTVVSALPCSHVYGNIVMNGAIAYGMTLVMHAVFDVERVLQSVEANQATMLEGVPTMYMYILNHPKARHFDVSSLTRCTVGGQTMPESKMRQVEALFGCPLIELWGMTELGGLGTTHGFYGPRKLGSIGIALPHVHVRIADPQEPERELGSGEVGELQVRGPITMREYVGRAEATAQALLPGGWLRTGDLARVDEDGFIFVVDRLKDMIITAGFNIYPAELERAIAEHPGVAMVVVGPMRDEIKGELAKAYVVAKHGIALDPVDLERHCRERLAAYKVPRAFQVVTDLPKTSSGKVLRRELHTLDPR